VLRFVYYILQSKLMRFDGKYCHRAKLYACLHVCSYLTDDGFLLSIIFNVFVLLLNELDLG